MKMVVLPRVQLVNDDGNDDVTRCRHVVNKIA